MYGITLAAWTASLSSMRDAFSKWRTGARACSATKDNGTTAVTGLFMKVDARLTMRASSFVSRLASLDLE